MIWKKCILMAKIKSEEDFLGNPIYTWEKVKKTVARFTPWKDEQVSLEDRRVTRDEQRYLLPLPYEKVSCCQKVEMDGHVLDITQIINRGPRYTAIQVKVYKE